MAGSTSKGPHVSRSFGEPRSCVLLLLSTIACSTAGADAGGSGGGGMSGSTPGGSGGDAGVSFTGGVAGITSSTVAGGGASDRGGNGPPAGAGAGAGASAGAGAGGAAGTIATAGGTEAGTSTGDAGATTLGGRGGAGASSTDTVKRTTSTYAFRHFPVATNTDGVWNGPTSPAGEPVTTTFDTVVLENGYLRVTLLPSYGGRVLSIVHKPTNRELLYQNPLGTPYLMQEDIFYYDYLVILGGIFPSFPEPEHGRYWNQPYDFEVVRESADAITVRMSRKDDRDRTAGVPSRYDVRRTDVLVQLDVTLEAGSAALELETKLTNTRNSAVPSFEYWTVTTLAPGSTPGQTAIPLDTRILAKMETVRLLEGSWPWFGEAEERVNGDVFKWNNLSYFKNWEDQGTAFANPSYGANWSGLSNYQNDTSIIRVSDNVQTPGLKLWTFGTDSLSIDITDGDQWLRPTIEMWHGITPEFWVRATLAANEVRSWKDLYFPTLGMREITAAGEHGALYLSSSANGGNTVLSAAATLVLPNRMVKAILRLDGNVVAEKDVVVAAADATTVTATVPSGTITAGTVFEAEFLQGDRSLLSAQTTPK